MVTLSDQKANIDNANLYAADAASYSGIIRALILYCSAHETDATPCGDGVNVLVPWINPYASTYEPRAGISAVYCTNLAQVRRALGY